MKTGIFVTGTGTGVGKTVLSAAIVASARAGGIDAIGLKPLLTGMADAPDPDWPPDHALLARVSGADADAVTGFTFGPPVSPHLAARLAGTTISLEAVTSWITEAASCSDSAVVEGVGGLLVPLAPGLLVADLAAALGMPLLIASGPGLGTINHTLLTLEAARSRGLRVLGVVMGPWPGEPDQMVVSNRETVEEIGGVPVWTLPRVAQSDARSLAAAAAHLPVAAWLASGQ